MTADTQPTNSMCRNPSSRNQILILIYIHVYSSIAALFIIEKKWKHSECLPKMSVAIVAISWNSLHL